MSTHAKRQRPWKLSTAIALGLLLTAVGCLDVDTQLRPNGSASVKLAFTGLDASGDELIRKQIQAPSVELVSATLKAGVGTYQLEVKDIEKLRTAPLLRTIRVEHDTDSPTRALRIFIPRRKKTEEEEKEPPQKGTAIRIAIELPGTITETNGKSSGPSRSAWELPKAELLGDGRVSLEVEYDPSSPHS